MKKLSKILVVGYGSIGKRYIENISLNSKIKIIVNTSRKEDKFLNQKKCQIYKSIEDCIKEKPDVAIICNPTDKHVKISKYMIQHSIPILIEKPLSNNFLEIESLIKLIQKKKLITMVGCNLRFNPFIKKIKKILDSKVLGKIYFVKAENGSFLPDWHPDEDYQRSYASSEKISGGLPLTLIHELDYLTWFFGEVDSLSSFGDKLSNLKISTNDISLTYLKFKNNVVAEIDLNIFQKPNYRSCKIIGSKAQLFWDTDSNKIKIYNYKSKKWSTKYHIKKYEP